LILFALIASVYLHPTKYPHVKKGNFTCANKQSPPTIISWHTHIVYMLTNSDDVRAALELRNKTIERFKDFLGEDCDGRYDNGRMCMIVDHQFNTTFGPFPVGEWSIFVPLPYFNLIIPYLSQHRGNLSYLVHPNTGCEYEDHSIWAFWVGHAWPLDMSYFEVETQTNEWDTFVGTDENPTCLKETLSCGHTEFTGPALACCSGSFCSCNSSMNDCQCKKLNSLKYLAK